MDLTTTLMAAAIALGACIFFGWRGARPPDLVRGPRLVPHRFLMLTAAAILLILTVHLVNLAGFKTGRSSIP